MTRQSLVDIIIVNFNGGEFISECIEAVRNQTFREFHVYVIDNNSTDGSVDLLAVEDERFTIVRNTENLGFAAACNQGAALGNAPWIAMLNPDTAPKTDWLEEAVRCGEKHKAEMVGCTMLSKRNPAKLDGVGDAYSPLGLAWRGGYDWPADQAPDHDGRIFGPCAAAALYRRDIYMDSGGFDEQFFCYVEDVDLAFRLRLYGAECVHASDAVVYHFGSGISGRRSEFTIFHGTRNRVWTWVKNAPPLMFVLTMPFVAMVNLVFLLRSAFHGKFRCTARALGEAIRGLGPILESRRDIQKKRTANSLTISKAMTWSPVKLLTRAPDIRRIAQPPNGA
ncbi:glycosyltransferase family 2 protein [Hyphobacterium sp.]|uniref:glycosyltransferase family 2 protein n=1 Tax=Hyphobacterium sp. TaxID=2004662 RepID=UPI003B5257B1